jgi:hypothetical protein
VFNQTSRYKYIYAYIRIYVHIFICIQETKVQRSTKISNSCNDKNLSTEKRSNVSTVNESGFVPYSLSESVGKVAISSILRTPLGKARGWIRLALNLRSLDDSLDYLLKDKNIINLFYTPHAILNNTENIMMLMAILRSLKVLPFVFNVEDGSLNEEPSWSKAMVENASRSTRSLSENAQPAPKDTLAMAGRSPSLYEAPKQSGLFSSFMSSIGSSITGMLDSVDQVDISSSSSLLVSF